MGGLCLAWRDVGDEARDGDGTGDGDYDLRGRRGRGVNKYIGRPLDGMGWDGKRIRERGR